MPRQIIYGSGASAEVGTLAAPMGSNALVVTGRHPDRHESVFERLDVSGIVANSFSIDHEPTVEDLRRGVRVARDAGSDLVISIGGGSALDTGKALSALVSNDGDVLEYLEVVGKGRRISDSPAPHIAIPTTAGTGSEATQNAVVLSGEHGIDLYEDICLDAARSSSMKGNPVDLEVAGLERILSSVT